MSMLRLYTRVLELLGNEARLGWILAGANLLLAGAQFAEPVLFGRIVDVLSGKPSTAPGASSSAWPLLAAWAAFGLFTIGSSAAVALHADRLAHRQRQAVLTLMTHLNQIGQTGSTPRHLKGLSTCCHGEEPHAVGWRFISERRAVNLDPNCGWARGKTDVLYVADAFEVMRKVNALLAAKPAR